MNSSVRVDLHCHSSASQAGRYGSDRWFALPECATDPHELYELAKRRGMDFVTITDHDSIAGALAISDRPDVFISEELTASFKGEQQTVHILCFGITPDDHDWLQARATDVVACSEYLHGSQIACALAHPFHAVAAPLTPAHRRTLATLFPTWETRNGTRPQEVNSPAAIYIETHGGIAIGGSDDHAGTDIARTWTKAPAAATTDEFLAHIRAGRVSPHGAQGGPAQRAHAAVILAARALAAGTPIGPVTLEDARALMRKWLTAIDPELTISGLIAAVQDDDFSHAELERRARRAHERRLADGPREQTAASTFDAGLPAIPYVWAAAGLARERATLRSTEGESLRVAVIADGVEVSPGLAEPLRQLREHGIRGHVTDVIGTDAGVDRRLPAVAEIHPPGQPDISLGIPSLFAVASALTDSRYDLVHVCSTGPTAVAALPIARAAGLPVVATYVGGEDSSAAAFYGQCRLVLSPSAAADRALAILGVPLSRVRRWRPGVDHKRYNPACYDPDAMPAGGSGAAARVNLLYAGRLDHNHGAELLADAFAVAHDRDPRLHLVLAGSGPDEQLLRHRLGHTATFLGRLDADRLARVYASADLLICPTTLDGSGNAILEAQASGLPVLAVQDGGAAELIDPGRSGCLVPAGTVALAEAIKWLARRATLRERLSTGGLLAVRECTWERSLEQLAGAWADALSGDHRQVAHAA